MNIQTITEFKQFVSEIKRTIEGKKEIKVLLWNAGFETAAQMSRDLAAAGYDTDPRTCSNWLNRTSFPSYEMVEALDAVIKAKTNARDRATIRAEIKAHETIKRELQARLENL